MSNNQVIPDAAVEAAAEWLPHSDDCEARPERDCTCWKPRVAIMRAALEGSAPHIEAPFIEALRVERAKVELLLSAQSRPAALPALATAWAKGHAAGRDYQGDGWNKDAHDPATDNPYGELA